MLHTIRQTTWSRVVITAMLAAALVLPSTPASALLDKTRFVAHLGVAYFAFHHWALHPFQQGAFADGAPHRTSAIIKAGVATLFAYHEMKVAQKIAQDSPDPLLQKLNGGLNDVMGNFATIGAKLKSGQFHPEDIHSLEALTSSFGAKAAENGATIKDVPAAIPGT